MEADVNHLARSTDFATWISPGVADAAKSIASLYESEKGKGDGWESPKFSWRTMRENCIKHVRKLGEANPSSAFGQLLRAGIQTLANGWYKRYPSTYQEIAQEMASDKRMEFHAPLYGSAFPRKVGAGTPWRESGIKGLDIEILNLKWGGMESFERELFDDDQTGQIRTRAQRLGEAMRAWEEAYFSRRFIGAADSTFPEPIPASSFGSTRNPYVNFNGDSISTPFSTSFYASAFDGAARGNRLATYVQFNFNSVLQAVQALRQAIDPQGVAMVVNPDTCLVSPFDEIEAKMAFGSPTFPAISGRSTDASVAAAEPGFFRGGFGMNPLQGTMKLVVNTFMKTGVWAIGQAQHGFVMQRRDPVEVVQEVPNSGQSFELDVIRFRTRSRWEQEWIWPGFWFLGNDGSASVSH